jgi:hypothetical protein
MSEEYQAWEKIQHYAVQRMNEARAARQKAGQKKQSKKSKMDKAERQKNDSK